MSSIDAKMNLVKQYLDLRIQAHSVISSNIVNADTPNFIAKQPTFEASLDKQNRGINQGLKASDKMWNLKLKTENSRAPIKEDGNNVILENEMSSMALNSLEYMSALKIINKQMALERYAIQSGR